MNATATAIAEIENRLISAHFEQGRLYAFLDELSELAETLGDIEPTVEDRARYYLTLLDGSYQWEETTRQLIECENRINTLEGDIERIRRNNPRYETDAELIGGYFDYFNNQLPNPFEELIIELA